MRTRERATAATLAVALAVSIFGVGGAFRWIQAIVAIVVAVSLAITLWSRRIRRGFSPLVVGLGVAAGLTAFQLLPLPDGLLRFLQPEGYELRERGASLMSTSPWKSLSLDAPGSLAALCFLSILVGVGVIATRIAVSQRGRQTVLAIVGGMCGVTAVVVGAHELVGATKLFGIYAPRQAHPAVLGPLLNENHLGGLMAVGAAVCLGLTMLTTQRSRVRLIWLVSTGACAAAALASQSRGATLALVGGFAVTVGVLVAQRLFGSEARRPSFARISLPIAIVSACALVVVLYASAGGITKELGRTSLQHEIDQPTSKIAIWRATLPLIEETPWVGVGRGAFESSITRYHPTAAGYAFSHVENEYLQTVVDWGVPGAILIAAAALWLMVVATRRWRDGPLAAGALGALVVIALQSGVDFGIEILGLAVPATMVISTLSYIPVKEVDARALLRSRIRIGALVAGLVAAGVLLLTPFTRSIREDHEALAEQKTPRMPDLAEVIGRHPLDFFPFALAADMLSRSRDPRAVTMLNHALVLHPTHPGLHHLAARILFRGGNIDQSVIEYAFAVRDGTTLIAMITEITTRFDAKRAARAIPTTLNTPTVVKILLDLGRSAVATEWLGRLLDEAPNNLQACDWLYNAAIQRQDEHAGIIASRRCGTSAPSYEARTKLASMLLTKGHIDDAAQLVADAQDWPGRIDVKVEGWLLSCDAIAARKQWNDTKRCLRMLDLSGLVRDNQRTQVTSRIDKVEEALRATPPQ